MAARIEQHLLTVQGWVTAAELCQEFGIKERELRGEEGKPGLVGDFAVRGNKGYRHVQHATDEEYDHCVRRLRSHGIAELQLARALRRRRLRVLLHRATPPPVTRDGQFLLIPTEP